MSIGHLFVKIQYIKNKIEFTIAQKIKRLPIRYIISNMECKSYTLEDNGLIISLFVVLIIKNKNMRYAMFLRFLSYSRAEDATI